MKDSIKETELQYFIDEFLPIAAHLRQRGIAPYTMFQMLFSTIFFHFFILILKSQ